MCTLYAPAHSLKGSEQRQEYCPLPPYMQVHIHFKSWDFTLSHGSIRLCQGAVSFCSLLSSFVGVSVCCAECSESPLCTHWSLLASYPLNISVFEGRLWGSVLAIPQDLSLLRESYG